MSDEVNSVEANEGVEKKDEAVVETVKKAVAPKMFIGEGETVMVNVDVISDSSDGKVTFVLPKGEAQKDEHGFFTFTPFAFEFSIPNYEQISTYRQRSSANAQGRFEKNMFRSFLLVNHLKNWEIKDSNNELVPLDFEMNGELTRDCLSKINRVPTIVWDTVLTLFEREAGIGNSSL